MLDNEKISWKGNGGFRAGRGEKSNLTSHHKNAWSYKNYQKIVQSGRDCGEVLKICIKFTSML